MTEFIESQKFAQVVQRLEPQAKLLRAWALKGGVSAQVTAVEFVRPDGQTQKVIVRQHGAVDIAQNSQIAADEFRLLQLLHSAGLPVPTPYYFDQSGEIFSTPYVVIEFIEGQPDFAPTNLLEVVEQLAAQLAQIHAVDVATIDLSFLPQQAIQQAEKLATRPAVLDDSLDEGRIRTTLESVWPLPPRNRPTLLHGDFWPGNVLGHAGQIAAVIDWEDARVGDPLSDLANSRLEILWAFGLAAMERFTQHYQALNPIDFTDLPYWDLCAALKPASKLSGWGLDAAQEKQMRAKQKVFVEQAYEKLIGR
jgi:aminoglycoside phosphotransferase (APT) family kinase protein